MFYYFKFWWNSFFGNISMKNHKYQFDPIGVLIFQLCRKIFLTVLNPFDSIQPRIKSRLMSVPSHGCVLIKHLRQLKMCQFSFSAQPRTLPLLYDKPTWSLTVSRCFGSPTFTRSTFDQHPEFSHTNKKKTKDKKWCVHFLQLTENGVVLEASASPASWFMTCPVKWSRFEMGTQ